MCVRAKKGKKGEGRKKGERKKEGWNTDFVRVCLVLLLVCNKRATGGQDCWCDFLEKKKFYKRSSRVWLGEVNGGSRSLCRN